MRCLFSKVFFYEVINCLCWFLSELKLGQRCWSRWPNDPLTRTCWCRKLLECDPDYLIFVLIYSYTSFTYILASCSSINQARLSYIIAEKYSKYFFVIAVTNNLPSSHAQLPFMFFSSTHNHLQLFFPRTRNTELCLLWWQSDVDKHSKIGPKCVTQFQHWVLLSNTVIFNGT